MFNVKIKKSSLIVSNKEPLAAGASKVYYVSFDFDDEWNSLLKNVVFKAGDISKAVLLEGDSCAIPWEVLSSENIGEKLWVGVYGSDTEGTKLPTVWNELEVIQAGAELCESGSEPTPTAVSLIYEAAKNAESMAKNAVEEASLARNHADRAEEAREAAESAQDEANSYYLQAEYQAGEADRFASAAEESMNDASYYASNALGYAQSADASALSAAESARNAAQNAVDVKKNCANALRGKLRGVSVSTDDVSPNEHELDIRVRSKNILPRDYIGRTVANCGVTAVFNIDGSVTVNGTSTGGNAFINLTPYKDFFVTEEAAMYSGTPQGLGFGLDTTARMILEIINPNTGVANHIGCPTEVTASHVDGKVLKGATVRRVYITVKEGYTVNNVTFYPQLEYGTVATEFTYPSMDVEGVNITVTDGENSQTATADAEGNVKGLMSLSPNMTLTTDNVGAAIECGYVKDTNKVIENLTNAIISLGGNI